MSDTKLKTSNIGDLAITHDKLHTTMDLTGKTVTVATPTADTHPATKVYVDTEVANLIDSAPGTLDTLNELAAAINDDANFNATIATSLSEKLPLAGGAMTGAITTNSTFDGRDVATDGTKLDTIETSATADQTDAEIRTAVEAATDSNVFTDADHSKLNAIEASADVTDTTNVTAAGALMDSEVTNLASVKAFDTTDYATAAQGTTADAALPKTGGTMTGALNLAAANLLPISATITDTAVDVFVYDTSKDSDGGAWRKRTQGTSWYNETLNTTTRGSRKEFPVVAVIVAETGKVTIYDGDDPAMPMWMKFNNSGSSMIRGSSNKTVAMLNSQLWVGNNNNYGGYGISFILDRNLPTLRASGSTFGNYGGSISERNLDKGWSGDTTNIVVSQYINDIAMTVLPNAPIDSSTGLPIPTIAVATNGGVSVIKDDGRVVDITGSNASYTTVKKVIITKENRLFFNLGTSSNDAYEHITDIPNVDTVITHNATDADLNDYYYDVGTIPAIPRHSTSGKVREVGAVGTDTQLTLLDENTTTPANGAVAYITSDYNTGYMVGDIKLAALSDTDTTNVVGTSIFTNDLMTGFNPTGGASFTVNSNGTVSVGNGTGTDAFIHSTTFTLVVGKTYVLDIQTSGPSGSGLGLYLNGTGGPEGYLWDRTKTFIATQTSNTFFIYRFGGHNGTGTIDNISLRLADTDHSVNANGLQAHGTITKSAVATGADLVGYSGFSSSNYLEQPYNSGLNFGTGDFSVMGWAYITNSGVSNPLFGHGNVGVNDGFLIGLDGGGVNIGILGMTSFLSTYTTQPSYKVNVWTQVCYVRKSATNYAYLDGVLVATWVGGLATTNFTTQWSNPITTFGKRAGTSDSTTGSLALWRISATTPSASQIKTIYEAEKPLFQENAKCTLYGTSDAVTALAHDDSTNLLHVGTSSGRSVFQGLRRVDNTTTAVGAAISASNGLVIED